MFSFSNDVAYDVRGKVALITGGGQGIGLALATELYKRGAKVALLDVNPETVESAAALLGERALGLTVDVRDRSALAAAVVRIVEQFGRVDVVVANAGVAPTPATLRAMEDADFDRVIDINLIGVFNTVRAGLEQVIENEGHVVVVASVAAFVPGPGGAAYPISKAGVEQLGRALRIELAPHGASAGVAYFGVVDTAMVHGKVEEDELAREMVAKMPLPFRKRISPDEAAQVLADGIAQRAARTIAPAYWQSYSLLRGAANVAVDHVMATNSTMQTFIRNVEARALANRRP